MTFCHPFQFPYHPIKTLPITFVCSRQLLLHLWDIYHICGIITVKAADLYYICGLLPLWTVITLVGVRKGFTVTLWFTSPQLSQSQEKIKQISVLTNQKSNGRLSHHLYKMWQQSLCWVTQMVPVPAAPIHLKTAACWIWKLSDVAINCCFDWYTVFPAHKCQNVLEQDADLVISVCACEGKSQFLNVRLVFKGVA